MSSSRFIHRLLLPAIAATMLAQAACGGGGTTITEPSRSASPTIAQDSRAAWLDLAKCMRANGFSTFPDPVEIRSGVWAIPPGVDETIPAACDQLFRTAKQATNSDSAPTAEEMAKLRQYASCMRDNGLSNFPDPDEDGNFGPDAQQPDDSTYRTAHDACKKYAPPSRPK
jgi:hypothetical protein